MFIDTNKEGYVSLEEAKAFYKAPEMTEAGVLHAFELLDTGMNGKISCEEFTAATEDFLFGVEEKEISKLFFGPLLD